MIYLYDYSTARGFCQEFLKKQGFKITNTGVSNHTAEKGKYSVIFTKECIRIRVKVSNFFRVQF